MFWPGVAETLWTALFCGLAAMYGYFRADAGAAEYGFRPPRLRSFRRERRRDRGDPR